jgi:hypothetical protein
MKRLYYAAKASLMTNFESKTALYHLVGSANRSILDRSAVEPYDRMSDGAQGCIYALRTVLRRVLHGDVGCSRSALRNSERYPYRHVVGAYRSRGLTTASLDAEDIVCKFSFDSGEEDLRIHKPTHNLRLRNVETHPSNISSRLRSIGLRSLGCNNEGFRVALEQSAGEVPLGADASACRGRDIVVLAEDGGVLR